MTFELKYKMNLLFRYFFFNSAAIRCKTDKIGLTLASDREQITRNELHREIWKVNKKIEL